MNLKELGDDFFFGKLKKLVDEEPYMSFVILSSVMEYIGKCYQKRNDFQESGHSLNDCYVAINNVEALKEYKKFNYTYKDIKGNDINTNYIYSHVRCGMLHAILPKDQMQLTNKKNDLANNTIGAEELYEDLKKAWEEIQKKKDVLEYLEKTTAINIYGNVSGNTASQGSSPNWL